MKFDFDCICEKLFIVDVLLLLFLLGILVGFSFGLIIFLFWFVIEFILILFLFGLFENFEVLNLLFYSVFLFVGVAIFGIGFYFLVKE